MARVGSRLITSAAITLGVAPGACLRLLSSARHRFPPSSTIKVDVSRARLAPSSKHAFPTACRSFTFHFLRRFPITGAGGARSAQPRVSRDDEKQTWSSFLVTFRRQCFSNVTTSGFRLFRPKPRHYDHRPNEHRAELLRTWLHPVSLPEHYLSYRRPAEVHVPWTGDKHPRISHWRRESDVGHPRARFQWHGTHNRYRRYWPQLGRHKNSSHPGACYVIIHRTYPNISRR